MHLVSPKIRMFENGTARDSLEINEKEHTFRRSGEVAECLKEFKSRENTKG